MLLRVVRFKPPASSEGSIYVRIKSWGLTGLIAAVLVPGAAYAQAGDSQPTPTEETRSEEGDIIVVTATGLSTASSSAKTETPIIETPQTISVVTRAEMDVRAVTSVADALSYVAGVQSQALGIDSRVDEVTVRGFGAGGFSSNNSFLDGLRLPTGGQWTRLAYDPFTLQQVEVLKGPSSVLYGQTAPGGIVNLVSRRPSFTFRGEAQIQAIGFNDLGNVRFQGGAYVTGPLSDSIAAGITLLASDGENQPNDSANSRYLVSGALTARLGPDTDWTVMAQYQRDEGASTFQFLPRSGSLIEVPGGGRMELQDFIGEPGWNVFERDQYMIASFFEHRFSDALTLRNNSRYTQADSLYRAVVTGSDVRTTCPVNIPGCIVGRTIDRRAVQGIGETKGFITDTQLQARFATGAVEHTLLGGVDYFQTDWYHYRDGVAPAQVLPILDILNPVPRGSAGYAGALTPQIYTETKSNQLGVYLQEQLSVGGLRVAIGGRYDWANDDIFNPINNRRFIVDSEAFTWNAGAVYLFDFGLAPYVSYAESFLPLQNDPTTSLNGEPFQPTTGQQIEAGLRYQPSGENIYVTLSAYEITQQNLLTPNPNGTLCGTILCSVQTGEGRFRGLELEGRASLRNGLSAVATVTRIDAEVTKSNTVAQIGNALPQVPDWQASLFLDYRFLDGALRGFGLGGGVRYTGDSFGDVTNSAALTVPDYTVFDLFLRYDLRDTGSALDGLSLSLNARNLTNEQFVATCTAATACYWGQGRTVTARLQYRF